mmetsp:Transcript_11299/g.28486  ORF Transcript_11299/g.28486 Transcript_11299/m.28486 type:complete len:291 (-) Transcript_11299:84-956(-)|eukprot:CAMPEP_0202042804 /NCGR_PEP_ID=MMETSP0962-20130828/28409_1 /ASSEMBLY_ACC=CAM_ASM_000488 /TAXON_ID=4773 /ORGANISM="Schizochytrium aggregatum, Strain ATCC28209" /LENGTH=290 /DNA_ID=CAMNT_0048607231 /DNA_START=87 /DNA_END=959 /DNA_ORIENTATION=+
MAAEVARDGDCGESGAILSGGALQLDESGEARIWACCAASGKVVRLDADHLDARSTLALSTRGSPSGVALEGENTIFVADLEHGALLKADAASGKFSPMVQDYEGERLLGPSSVAIGADRTIYFTDSGPLGESSLESPRGSVFAISRDENGQILRPLALHCLAHPCGVCPVGNHVYVAELLKNRILRFTKLPHGAYLCSVLHQFSGRIGPSAIASDPNDPNILYVARFDVDGASGLVSVLDTTGAEGGLVRDIDLLAAGGSAITGLLVNPEANELIVFESTAGRVLRVRM